MRGRYYDPLTQHLLTRDPAELSPAQPYVYAKGNPVNYVDPTGATALRIFGNVLGQGQDDDDDGGGNATPPVLSGGGSGPRLPGGGSSAGAAQKVAQESRRPIKSRPAGGSGPRYDVENGQGVYVYIDEQGNVRYVGRGDAPGRASDHSTRIDSALKTTAEKLRQIIVASNNLTAAEARGLEELLIVKYGDARNRGGTLLNRDGAISIRNSGRQQMLRTAAPLFLEAIDIIDSSR